MRVELLHVGEGVGEVERAEAAQRPAVSQRGAGLAALGEEVVRGPDVASLAEDPEPDVLRTVEEPGDPVVEVEELALLAGLNREAQRLAAATEIGGADGELSEEAGRFAPAAAELELGAFRLFARLHKIGLVESGYDGRIARNTKKIDYSRACC